MSQTIHGMDKSLRKDLCIKPLCMPAKKHRIPFHIVGLEYGSGNRLSRRLLKKNTGHSVYHRIERSSFCICDTWLARGVRLKWGEPKILFAREKECFAPRHITCDLGIR